MRVLAIRGDILSTMARARSSRLIHSEKNEVATQIRNSATKRPPLCTRNGIASYLKGVARLSGVGRGSAPTGFPLCTLCGRGGADVRIMHSSHIDFWHRACAEEYFAAPVPEPESQIERDV